MVVNQIVPSPSNQVSIALVPFDQGDLLYGWSWVIKDEDALARQIAIVSLGQSRHVERILAGAMLARPSTTTSSAAAASKMVTVQGKDPSHRDGWLFQVISWIAAHGATPGGLIRSPQMQLADKGFDGLQLELDDTNQVVTGAIVFEDKATENPRSTIREEVWQSFSRIEAGERDNVLTAEVTTLLSTRPSIDPDRAIQNVLWKAVRRYRVSITINEGYATEAGRKNLFKGYDVVASGEPKRRRGETLQIPSLRSWMAHLATKVLRSIQEIASQNV